MELSSFEIEILAVMQPVRGHEKATGSLGVSTLLSRGSASSIFLLRNVTLRGYVSSSLVSKQSNTPRGAYGTKFYSTRITTIINSPWATRTEITAGIDLEEHLWARLLFKSACLPILTLLSCI